MPAIFSKWLRGLRTGASVAITNEPTGWMRVDGQLVYREAIPFSAQDWLHPLNAIRGELGRSGSVEHMPSIDTTGNPLREVLPTPLPAPVQSHRNM